MRTGGRTAVLSVLILALAAGELVAQRGGMRGGRGGGFSPLSFNYDYISSAGANGPVQELIPGLKVGVTTLGVRLNLPVFGMRGRRRDREDEGPRRWLITHGLGYHQRKITYENWSDTPGIGRLDRLHGIDYQFTLINRFSPRWHSTLRINPGVYSDLEGGLNQDHWQVQAGFLLDRVLSAGFVVGVGAAWTTTYGKGQLLPILHIESRPTANPHFLVMLPTLAELSWRLDSGVVLGGAARVEGNLYGLGEFDNQGDVFRIDRLRYSNVNVGPFAAFRVGRMWRLTLEAGGTLHRKYATYLNKAVKNDYDLENASFFKIGLRAGL